MEIDIRIPERHRDRYLRGGCFAFANELRRHIHREIGVTLPLRAVWVDGEPHHAFLIDVDRQCAYDARGRLPLDLAAISAGSAFEGAGEIAPITVRQMREWARSMDGQNARMDIARYVHVEDELQ